MPSKIADKNKMYKRKDSFCRKIVTEGLLVLGYDASICKSRWEKSPYYPTGRLDDVTECMGCGSMAYTSVLQFCLAVPSTKVTPVPAQSGFHFMVFLAGFGGYLGHWLPHDICVEFLTPRCGYCLDGSSAAIALTVTLLVVDAL